MDGLGVEIDNPLVIVRAIHFASTAIVLGALIFRTAVVEPISNAAEGLTVRKQARRIATISLAITVASAAVFLPLQAANMSGQSLSAAMTTEVLWTVIAETQFGVVLTIRLLLAIILFGCLMRARLKNFLPIVLHPRRRLSRWGDEARPQRADR